MFTFKLMKINKSCFLSFNLQFFCSKLPKNDYLEILNFNTEEKLDIIEIYKRDQKKCFSLLKNRYIKLVKENHPDLNKSIDINKIKEINGVYKKLSNSDVRKDYFDTLIKQTNSKKIHANKEFKTEKTEKTEKTSESKTNYQNSNNFNYDFSKYDDFANIPIKNKNKPKQINKRNYIPNIENLFTNMNFNNNSDFHLNNKIKKFKKIGLFHIEKIFDDFDFQQEFNKLKNEKDIESKNSKIGVSIFYRKKEIIIILLSLIIIFLSFN